VSQALSATCRLAREQLSSFVARGALLAPPQTPRVRTSVTTWDLLRARAGQTVGRSFPRERGG